MRIEGRRPLAVGAHRADALTYALAFLLLLSALFAAAAIYRVLLPGGETRASAAALTATLADAYGLGGLPLIGPPAASANSSPLRANDVVAYYGSPRTPSMGILGQYEEAEAARLLAARAAAFDALNGDRGVLPAFHLVYGIAQPEAGRDGLYLRYIDDRTVQTYLQIARRNGFALVLDLQIGHSDALTEIRKIERYLAEPDVFVAIDPEFALAGRSRPGAAIGAIDANAINDAQAYLAGLADKLRLPKKLLIVHQFQDEMISGAERIERRDDVDVIIDMDGYGPAEIKQVKYGRYGAAPYAQHGGIKIFLEHDPDPMTEQQLLDIEPRPVFFLYQ